MRAPEFWGRDGMLSRVLTPLSWVYRAGAMARAWSAEGWRAPVPVICVGNLVSGGAGKTPVALSVAERLAVLGVGAHFLTRGYGGRHSGPVLVDPATHAARQVGDEPLLLSRRAPTWVSRDRVAGARAAADAGAGAVVMDDGHQNPALVKDLAIVVVDGVYGFGNARIVPAGPLRESIARGLDRADAAVVIGPFGSAAEARLPSRLARLRARIVPAPGAERFAGQRVVAFAGIGRPEKFFATLREMGCDTITERPFPDHHAYGEAEIMALIDLAAKEGAIPLTTAKDAVRLPASAQGLVEILEIDLEWEDPDALSALLVTAVAPADGRTHG